MGVATANPVDSRDRNIERLAREIDRVEHFYQVYRQNKTVDREIAQSAMKRAGLHFKRAEIFRGWLEKNRAS